MKKILIILAAILAVSVVQAQEFHFIPKIGLNVATMTNSDMGARPGMNVGAAVEIPIFNKFMIEPGIMYSMQGAKESDDGVTAKIKNDYLNIPIYAKYYIYDGFYAFAGPQFGFNVHSKISASQDGNDVSFDTKDMFKTFDFSLGFGLGYQLDMGLMISMNYNIGLTDTLDDGEINLGNGWGHQEIDWGNEKSRNGVFQFNIGWRF